MSIERAEQLKREFTDKWVTVDKSVPELRRFSGRTGKVKTVNMNCQALVEFDSSEDIGWYDINTTFLTIVDGPVKKEKPKAAAAKADAPKSGGGAKPKASGASPLDLIRGQGAGGAKKKAAKKAAGGSPLDLIRKQGAAGSKKAEEAAPEEATTEQAEAPAEEKKAPAGGGDDSKLSPLEQIRKQGAFKG